MAKQYPWPDRGITRTQPPYLATAMWAVALTMLAAHPSRAQEPASTGADATASNAIVGDCGTAPDPTSKQNVDYVMVYKSSQSIVCVDSAQWAQDANATAIKSYFPYFDAIIAEDKALFPVKAPKAPFVFEITAPNATAHTGTDFKDLGAGRNYGNTIGSDFFSAVYKDPATARPITGFWGYLLPLHESINVFTGLLAQGWPTDWWADHRSPFPNAMDVEFMKSIANTNKTLGGAARQSLLASSAAQLARFTDKSNPGGEYDPEVGMFVDFFDRYGGFKAYANAFRYAINQDGLKWPSVSGDAAYTGDDNYSENLSEYVVAYLHLGFGVTHDLTPSFSGAGVGTLDTTIPSYTLNSYNVKAIANAHCSIRAAKNAGVDVSVPLSGLQAGNFGNATAQGGTQASCPSECAFVMNQCVAKF